MDTTEQAVCLALCLAAWSLLSFLLQEASFPFLNKLSPHLSNDIKNRIISILHGLISLLGSAYFVFFSDLTLESNNTFLCELIYCIGISYAIVDLISCYFYGLDHTGLYIHHFLVILGQAAILLQGRGALLGFTGYFAAQVTNPQMHLRAIIKSLGYRYTMTYELLELGYLLPYVLFRGVYMSYKLIPLLLSENGVLLKMMMMGLYLQSCFYIAKMYGMIKRKRRQWMQMKRKGVWYWWSGTNPRLAELSFYECKERQEVF